MKIPKSFMHKVNKIILELMNNMMMPAWKMDTVFHDHDSVEGGLQVAAKINPTPHYKSATMHIYPLLYRNTKDDPSLLKEALTHETLHCLTHDLYMLSCDRFATRDEIGKANEKLIQQIARFMTWNYAPLPENKRPKPVELVDSVPQKHASRNKREKTKVHNNRNAKKRDRVHG